MLLGPIFSLELLTCARRGRYYLLRVLYALVLLFTLAVTYETAYARRPFAGIHGVANVARDFFSAFGFVQLSAVLLLGPAMVAGTIAQQRERRTIEYLLTSQLSNADIVLGTLAARLLNVGYVVASGLPVLALAMLLGGIPPAAMLNLALLTLESLVAVGALSMAVSVGRRRTRDAVVAAYVLLAAVLVLPPLGALLGFVRTGALLPVCEMIAACCEPIAQFNPFALLSVMSWRPPEGEALVWRLLTIFAVYAGFAAACLALAIGGLRRLYARSAGRAAGRGWLRWPSWRPGVGNRPMNWKEMFIEPSMGRLGVIGRIAFLLLVGSLFVAWLSTVEAALTRGVRSDFIPVTTAFACSLECFGLLLAAARGATLITSEKERDCLVTLLSTPLTGSEIMRGKLLGNLYSMRWIAALVLVLWLTTLLVAPTFAPALAVQLAVWLLLAVYASWLGIAFSLWCRSSLRAMAATLAVGIFLGGLYLPFVMLPLQAVMIAGRSEELIWILLTPCIPYLLAYPAAFWDSFGSSTAFDRTGFSFIAFALGCLGYAALTAIGWRASVGNFNRLVGRMPPSGEARSATESPASEPEAPSVAV